MDERTQHILQLYDQGQTYRQIAAEVGISHETARTYVRRHRDTTLQPPSVDDDGSCWMTIAEASEALGVQRVTISNRIAAGRIEARRVGRYQFVRVYDTECVDSRGLSPRIKRMADLRSEGLTYAAIGEAIGMSGSTVQWHLTRRGIAQLTRRPRTRKEQPNAE